MRGAGGGPGRARVGRPARGQRRSDDRRPRQRRARSARRARRAVAAGPAGHGGLRRRRGRRPYADGWFATGDLCSFDADGNLYAVDRLKELIKVGGYSVAPAEVERELAAHPAVADAAVVGRAGRRARPGAGGLRRAARARPATCTRGSRAGWRPGSSRARSSSSSSVPRSPAGKLLRRQFATSRAELGPARDAELGERRRRGSCARVPVGEVEALADLAVREARRRRASRPRARATVS